jgi:cell division protein FtsZ
VNEASSIIKEVAHEDAQIIFGSVIDDNMQGEIRVTVIATGFGYSKEATAAIPLVLPTKKTRATSPAADPQPVGNGAGAPVFRRTSPSERFRERVSVPPSDDKSLEIPTFLRKRSQAS